MWEQCVLPHALLSHALIHTYAPTRIRKSVSTVRRIVNEGLKNDGKFETPGKHRKGRPKKEMDDFNICALRQKIQFFYTVQKEVPTLRKLQVIARTDLDFDCSLEVLRKILKAIGFTYKKCQNNRKALIERSHIAAKREEYLAIINKNRDDEMRATFTLHISSLLKRPSTASHLRYGKTAAITSRRWKKSTTSEDIACIKT
ncbi:hypothetical protein K1T71_001268 [Dendrolimus kikuchii]|uniref:Uncharacterized protein n=1 Tax=Dendrolimus kikuchii TaxID=765133 RepID=A0ACC1DIP0_9NEOP|nr:hypothetical protein K1T71_001268 [Dendrolimus kikuchii]